MISVNQRSKLNNYCRFEGYIVAIYGAIRLVKSSGNKHFFYGQTGIAKPSNLIYYGLYWPEGSGL